VADPDPLLRAEELLREALDLLSDVRNEQALGIRDTPPQPYQNGLWSRKAELLWAIQDRAKVEEQDSGERWDGITKDELRDLAIAQGYRGLRSVSVLFKGENATLRTDPKTDRVLLTAYGGITAAWITVNKQAQKQVLAERIERRRQSEPPQGPPRPPESGS